MTKPKSVSVRRMTITPQKAEEWLSAMKVNRKLNHSKVSAMVADILDGRWQDNGDTIKLNKSEVPIDGQHRLKAIVMSGQALSMLVAFNVPNCAMATIDSATARTTANHLQIFGKCDHNEAGTIAAALRYLWAWEQGYAIRSAVPPTHQQLLELFASTYGLHDSVTFARQHHWGRLCLQPSMVAALHYKCRQKDEEMADMFFDALWAGSASGLEPGDPIVMLHERLFSDYTRRSKMRRSMVLALTIKAWNCTRQGRRVQVLKWMQSEEFPGVE